MIGCDLGTNTLRVVEIDCETRTRVKEFERIVRTGQNLKKTGKISTQAIHNILEALKDASRIFDFANHKVKCVTTEAMRLASNSSEILQRIKEEFGLNFQIISGDEEAKYTLMGVQNALHILKHFDNDFCMFDLGGGSTEIIYANKPEPSYRSFPFGILKISEKYNGTNALEVGIKNELSQVDDFVRDHKKPKRLIATAGTPTTVCAFLQGMDYKSYDHKRITGQVLSRDDFKKAYKQLFSLDLSERERFCGTNRSDLIKSGILIVIGLMEKLGFDECLIVDDGLREGVALSLCHFGFI